MFIIIIIIIIIIIVVVVVVDDDDSYWVLLLGLLDLPPSILSLLQRVTSFITNCDSLFYYKVRQVFQSATIITKCDTTLFESEE